VGSGGDTRLIATPGDEHHRLSVPQGLHHRSMARVANEKSGSFQDSRMRNGLLDPRVGRMTGELRWVVFRSERDQDADPLIPESANRSVGELDVVLPL